MNETGLTWPPVAPATGVTTLHRSTYATFEMQPLHTDLEIYTVFSFLIILQVIGSYGNLMTIVGLKKKTNLNLLIKNISLVCLIECIWTITISYISVWYRGWILPDIFMRLTGFIDNSLYVCCVWILVLSALERYLSLRHPLTYRRFCKHPRGFIAAIGSCWILSFAICTYPLVMDQFDFDIQTFAVGLKFSPFVFLYVTVTFAVPLLIIGGTYAEILRLARKRIKAKKAIEEEHGLPMPSRKLDFRLALMVIMTFMNIAGTHIPAIIFIIVHLAGVELEVSKRLAISVNMCLIAGFALQSYVFLATIWELQDAYRAFFCYMRREKKEINGSRGRVLTFDNS